MFNVELLSEVFVGVSETGDVSGEDLIRDRSPHKHYVNMGELVPDHLFWPRRQIHSYLRKV